MINDAVSEKFYTIIYHYVFEGKDNSDPLLQKVGNNVQNLYLFKSELDAFKFLEDNGIRKEGYEIVSSDHPVIKRLLEDAKKMNWVIQLVKK